MKYKSKLITFTIIFILVLVLAFRYFSWCNGKVVASAKNGEYTLTVHEIPSSKGLMEFIVSLFSNIDGRYYCLLQIKHIPITSCTFTWDSCTIKKVKINWQEQSHFTIEFEHWDIIECEWGRGYAVWSNKRWADKILSD